MKVCFCATSLKWIAKHLQKSARPMFRRMMKSNTAPQEKFMIATPRGFKSLESLKAARKRRGKRHFSRKQLAAQRLFAKRARAGTLRKGRRKRRR